MTQLTLRDVTVRAQGRAIVDHVSLTLSGGGITGLIGPNGAGKTTLVRAIAGLARNVTGSITLDGAEVAALPAHRRARRIAYLPQGGQAHWPMTAARVAALGRAPHLSAFAPLSAKDSDAVDAALAACDCSHLAARPVTSLSGGERALVLLARALAVEAPILLADEPVAALDPAHQLQIMDLLAARAAEGALVVVVLHDLALASRYCRDLILLKDGQVRAMGGAVTVLNAAALADTYGIEAIRIESGSGTVIIPARLSGAGGPAAQAAQ